MQCLSQICQRAATPMPNGHEKLITPLRLKPKNASGRVSLQSSVEGLREHSDALAPQTLSGQLEALVERTEDFTDSAYTSHEQRQAILGVCQLVRQDTQQLAHAWVEAVRQHARAHTPSGISISKSRCYDKNKKKTQTRERAVTLSSHQTRWWQLSFSYDRTLKSSITYDRAILLLCSYIVEKHAKHSDAQT